METCRTQAIPVGGGERRAGPAAEVVEQAAPSLSREGVRFRDEPLFLLAVLVAVVAVGDYGVMLVLAQFPSMAGAHAALIGSLGLVALAFPALLILVVRPLRRQIASRRQKELELRQTIAALERSQTELRQLRGLLPICASCKRIRDGDGEWAQLEQYIEAHSEASFTHSICPDCVRTLYPSHRAGQAPPSRGGGGA